MDGARAEPVGCADIVEANLPALRALCRRFGMRRLDLFGSAATGRFDPARSDLDFLVEFEKPPSGGFSSDYFKLLEALEALFQRKIDLVKECTLVKSASADRIRKTANLSAAMISNTAAKYLWDVQHAIDRIVQFTTGRTFDDYLTDEMLSAAIERQFEIIGEALSGLRRRAPDVAAIIPDIRRSSGFATFWSMHTTR